MPFSKKHKLETNNLNMSQQVDAQIAASRDRSVAKNYVRLTYNKIKIFKKVFELKTVSRVSNNRVLG